MLTRRERDQERQHIDRLEVFQEIDVTREDGTRVTDHECKNCQSIFTHRQLIAQGVFQGLVTCPKCLFTAKLGRG